MLNRQLGRGEYVAGDYSIADMAIYPWIKPYERQGQKLEDFPEVKRWFETMGNRPGVIAAYEKGKPWMDRPSVTEEGKKILFGQTAAVVAATA